MQNRYFGDVGDYGKYGLLRVLCGLNETPQLRLGVVWYLYPDENHNQDGKHLGYLRDATYRTCDKALYDSLRSHLLDDDGVVRPDSRHLDTLSLMETLPSDTVYYAAPLAYPPALSFVERQETRKNWFAGALAQSASAEIIFVDPDNGIECTSVSRLSRKGPKYVYWDDLRAFKDRGQALVVYHHLNRSAAHATQLATMLSQIREQLPNCEPMAVVFRRGSSRAYFIIPSPANQDLLRSRLERFAHGPWRSHFTLLSSASGASQTG